MFCSTSLICFVFFAVSASANPILKVRDSPITLPVARHFSLDGANVAEIDLARVSQLIDTGLGDIINLSWKKREASFNVASNGLSYTTNVGIGSPPTTYTLLVDLGSSNTWIGANRTYAPTSTSQNTGKKVSRHYSGGESFEGLEYLDTVTLSPELAISDQSIGVASKTSGVNKTIDGFLGLGPVGLTDGSVEGEGIIPTVTKNLFSQGKIKEEVLGVFFSPTKRIPSNNGFLTFGGVETGETTSDIYYVPVTDTFPSSQYWGFNQTITYGSTGETILPNAAGIIDTGSTLLLLSTSAFNKYVSLTGATLDESTGLLKISNATYDKVQSLFFNIGDQTYEFTANAQTWPRSLNSAINGADDAIYLIVADMKRDIPGFSFINGCVFLERFYSVFDATSNRLGFATTSFTHSPSN